MLSQCVQSFSSHCRGALGCVFDACVWGGWTKAMCLVRSHTNAVSLLQITWRKKKTDNQMYKTCLVSNRPATSSSYTLGIITPKSLVTALVSLGLCEINTHKHTHKKKNLFDFSHQLTRHRLNLWHLSARTASFTMQNLLFNIRNDCLQCALYKKNDYFLSVYCILRLSLSTPVLNFPSRFLKPF